MATEYYQRDTRHALPVADTMTDDALAVAIRQHIAAKRSVSIYDDGGHWPTVRVIGDFESIGGF